LDLINKVVNESVLRWLECEAILLILLHISGEARDERWIGYRVPSQTFPNHLSFWIEGLQLAQDVTDFVRHA
jgi:hypothetical protein